MNRFLQEAFDKVCSEAKPAEGFYVSLMEHEQYYGGPEEGGWHGTDINIVAYQWFATEEAAEAALKVIKELANEMNEEAKRGYGRHCLETMEQLNARGLDADYLPEPDGPATYEVVMSQGLPQEYRGPRHYE